MPIHVQEKYPTWMSPVYSPLRLDPNVRLTETVVEAFMA